MAPSLTRKCWTRWHSWCGVIGKIEVHLLKVDGMDEDSHDKAYLQEIAGVVLPFGTKIAAVTGKYPAPGIIAYARKESVNLIAMAAPAEVSWAKLLLFSGVAPLFLVHNKGMSPVSSGAKKAVVSQSVSADGVMAF